MSLGFQILSALLKFPQWLSPSKPDLYLLLVIVARFPFRVQLIFLEVDQ